MFKSSLANYKLYNSINKLIVIFCLFIFSGCGGSAGTAGIGGVSGYDSGGENAVESDVVNEVNSEEDTGEPVVDNSDLTSADTGEVNGNDNEGVNTIENDETGGVASDVDISETTPVDFVKLSWAAPVSDAIGSPLTDLHGYMIYYRKNDVNSQIASIDVGDVEYATINNLSSGTWCFAVTAYNSSGRESNFSEYVCKDI